MSSRAACVHCQVDSGCLTQATFDSLAVSAPPHDEMLVQHRMLGLKTSDASIVPEPQSKNINNNANSNYVLMRFLASCGKLGSFWPRRQRAKTDLEALFPPVQRSNTK